MEDWKRQKQEIDSYNLFYSAITHRSTTKGFIDFGYRLVGQFVQIDDHRNDLHPSPDFTLYDGESVLLVELKSGENINPSDINQME